MIKSLVIIASLLVSIHSYSQNLECGNNIDIVKKAIVGNWKLKENNNNKIYRFWFNQENGFVEALEELNLPPKAEHTQLGGLIINEQVPIKIKLVEGHFFIEIIYPFGVISEQIYKLNKNTFVYGKGVSEYHFVKDTN